MWESSPVKKDEQKNTISISQCSDNSCYVGTSTIRSCGQKTQKKIRAFPFFSRIPCHKTFLPENGKVLSVLCQRRVSEGGCNWRSLLWTNGCIWESWAVLMSGHIYHGDEISELIEFMIGHTRVIQWAFEQKFIMQGSFVIQLTFGSLLHFTYPVLWMNSNSS